MAKCRKLQRQERWLAGRQRAIVQGSGLTCTQVMRFSGAYCRSLDTRSTASGGMRLEKTLVQGCAC